MGSAVYAQGYGATLFLHFALLYNIKVAGIIVSSIWLDLPLFSSTRFAFVKRKIIKYLGLLFDVR